MTAKRLIIGILALLVIAAVMTPSLVAQSLVSGDLTGTVTDPTGAVLPNAAITLKSDATGETKTATTNTNGSYRFSLLRGGTYTLTVTAPGFAKTETKANVSIGQTSITDVKMAVGGASQTVEVTTTALLVNAENADLSTAFSQNLISNLPNGGNDLTYVAQTAPGVTMNSGGGYGNFTSNGLPATSNLFTVNGENDMDPYLNLNNSGATNLTLGKNEVQEATVISNAYSGEYGQQAGAQVTYITKGGTNQYHGNAIYWWTGATMDANDWFNNHTGAPRPFNNNNQWATSFGGPIKKDKNFFFVDYEGIRYIVPNTQTVYYPSQDLMNAAIANLTVKHPDWLPLYQKYDSILKAAPGYLGGTPLSGGSTCSGIPGVTNCLVTYTANPTIPSKEWILAGRDDQNFSDKDHVFWRVRMDHGTQATYADPLTPAFDAASFQPSYDGQSQWNHTFNPNVTNQFIVAGSYYRAIFTQNDPGIFPYGFIGSGINWTANPNYTFPQGRNVTQYQIIDDLSWTKGKHSFKFGENYRRYDITDYVFSVLNNPELITGSFKSFYNGTITQSRVRYPSRSTEPVALWGVGMYAQDEWKAAKNLKLTFALRFEHNSNPVCQLNCSQLLTTSFQNLVAANMLTKDTPYNSIIDANRHQIYQSTDGLNVSPRFGFAWTPTSSGNTVIRGGFGIFYDALAATIGDALMRNLPNLVEVRISNSQWANTGASGPYAQGSASAQAIMTGFSQGATFNSLTKQLGAAFRTPTFNNQTGTFHTPAYEQWSFGVQQALGDKSSLSLGYVGNHGYHVPIYNEAMNAYDPDGVPGVPLKPATSIFGTVQQYTSTAVSNYNGVTVAFNQRMTYGFTVQASYTWGQNNDEVSNGGFGLNYSSTGVQYQLNPTCLRCSNYGPSDADVRHSFNAAYVWNMPFKFGSKAANAILGGWVLSQNFFARSGLPYTVFDGNYALSNWSPLYLPAQVLQGVQSPCQNGNSICVPFNSFDQNTPGSLTTFPNQRRNSYRGPMFFDSDFSVAKNIKLTERFTFQFGMNFYNVFNHPNFAQPDNNTGDGDPAQGGTFGQILNTTAPPTGPFGSFATGLPSGRVIQFQGKIVF